jgi:hypothetical protein
VNHSHEYGVGVITLRRNAQAAEATGNELQASKVDGFTKGESNIGLAPTMSFGE